MQLIEFQKKLSMFPIFSLQDVQKIAPNFYRIQLDRWHPLALKKQPNLQHHLAALAIGILSQVYFSDTE